MQTDDLIGQLSAGLEPVRPGAMARLLVPGIAGGVFASTLVMLVALGLRPDLADAMTGFGVWMKLIYTFVIAALGLWLVERAGRPGAPMSRPLVMLVLPALAILTLAGLQMAAPGADIRMLMMGHSA